MEAPEAAARKEIDRQLQIAGLVVQDVNQINGAFPTDDQQYYLEAWTPVESTEQVPLAVARRAFGHDPKELSIELNEALIA